MDLLLVGVLLVAFLGLIRLALSFDSLMRRSDSE